MRVTKNGAEFDHETNFHLIVAYFHSRASAAASRDEENRIVCFRYSIGI